MLKFNVMPVPLMIVESGYNDETIEMRLGIGITLKMIGTEESSLSRKNSSIQNDTNLVFR
jgi:hypothetical protein